MYVEMVSSLFKVVFLIFCSTAERDMQKKRNFNLWLSRIKVFLFAGKYSYYQATMRLLRNYPIHSTDMAVAVGGYCFAAGMVK